MTIAQRCQVFLSCLLLASCNEGPEGPQGPVGPPGSQGLQGIQGIQGIQGPAGVANLIESGSRLTALRDSWTGADGSKASDPDMNVFHDTLLNVDCWPRTAADGEVRCLPWNERAWIDDWTGFYVDSACTTQAAVVIVYQEYLNPDCSAPQYASSSVTSTPACGVSGGRTQVNLVGAPTSVYLRSGGNCTSAAEAATSYYRVGDVVAPSTFVRFTKG